MPHPIPTVAAWSGGKDSAMALWRLLQDPAYEVTGVLTTLSDAPGRVQMHGVREALLWQQVAALGLPVRAVRMPPGADNATYQARMGEAVRQMVADGVGAIAFGDLFLEDIRAYREGLLADTGLQPVFPLWGADTAALGAEVHAAGFRAVLCCIDPGALSWDHLGRAYEPALLAELPAGVDPCGEHGEFHTFVHDGPLFQQPVRFTPGERVERHGFAFLDLLPA